MKAIPFFRLAQIEHDKPTAIAVFLILLTRTPMHVMFKMEVMVYYLLIHV